MNSYNIVICIYIILLYYILLYNIIIIHIILLNNLYYTLFTIYWKTHCSKNALQSALIHGIRSKRLNMSGNKTYASRVEAGASSRCFLIKRKC